MPQDLIRRRPDLRQAERQLAAQGAAIGVAAADAAQRAADISREQYLDGMVDFNTVISTLRSLAGQQDQLASIQGAVTTNLVDVYKSLGGGWQVRTGRDPVDLLPDSTRQEMLDRTKAWRKVFKAQDVGE
jgi:outer membrane protein TolC